MATAKFESSLFFECAVHYFFVFEFTNATSVYQANGYWVGLEVFFPSFKDVRTIFVTCELFLISQPAM